MRIAITGHTNGLGLELYRYFVSKGCDVIGFSRSNGYQLPDTFYEICETILSYDLFINNAYVDDIQVHFIKELGGKLPIISCGSMASDYVLKTGSYGRNKLLLENTHKKIKKITNVPMLLLKMGYLENYPNNSPILYQEVINAIECWFKNSRISMIEFENSPMIYSTNN